MIDPRPIEHFKFTQEEYDLYQSGVEIWRDIEGFIGWYQISTFGRVKTLSRKISNWSKFRISEEKIKVGNLRKDGYIATTFCVDCKITMKKFHRLVGEAFLYNPENKIDINHLDGVRHNNMLNNLEWATRSENKLHGFRIGITKPTCLGRFGKAHHRSKPVYKIDALSGNIIERYEGGMDASRKCGLDHKAISKAARNENMEYMGYRWIYECDLVSL